MATIPLIVLGTLAFALCIAGILEFQYHLRSLDAFPTREYMLMVLEESPA
ncbi:hypothetical protein Ct9H90mP29_05850 [bacterium]|nr:MAG: hypothetical protein Ct9H90mP29_05850 [bacterium]